MKHKPNILFIGFQNTLDIESMNQIAIKKCDSGQQAIELILEEDFSLIISKYQVEDQNALEFNQSVEAVKNYYANSAPKKVKLLIITSNPEEEQLCKDNKLLFYPDSLNLKSLVLKLIELPRELRRNEKKPAVIDFKELFIRVDNNRKFIQTVIEKFFEIKESRINDIKAPLLKGEYKQAKDAAHKLKGVLANFSMQEARISTIELEKLILENNMELSLQKLQQLIDDIEKAKDFYENNLDLFKA